MAAPIATGTLLQDRYSLVGAAGQSPFGQTYLARDSYAGNQLCLIKEFCPINTDPLILEARQHQFNREAAPLLNFVHPHLPRLSPLFAQAGRLYLACEYIEGKNYTVLLEERQIQGTGFSQSEVRLLILQVLPVLEALHGVGIVHGNLSLDNLIQGQPDGVPVLINPGLVRELVIRLQLHPVPSTVRVGRWGFAAPEQRKTGQLLPATDIFALGMVAVTLLAGQLPEAFFDRKKRRFQWEAFVQIDPDFLNLLRRMLHPDPAQRFASVTQVFQALNPPIQASAPLEQPSGTHPPSTEFLPHPSRPRPKPVAQSDPDSFASLAVMAALGLFLVVVGWRLAVHFGVTKLPLPFLRPTPAQTASPSEPTLPSPNQSPGRTVAPEALRDRLGQVGIDLQFFTTLVNEMFYTRYPQLQAQGPGSDAQQSQYKTEWNTTANGLLDKLAGLPPETLRKLGTYRRVNYDQWLSDLGEAGAPKSRVLDPLADQKFYQLFPEMQGKPLNPRTFGQIWYAIAEEQLSTAKGQRPVRAPSSNQGL